MYCIHTPSLFFTQHSTGIVISSPAFSSAFEELLFFLVSSDCLVIKPDTVISSPSPPRGLSCPNNPSRVASGGSNFFCSRGEEAQFCFDRQLQTKVTFSSSSSYFDGSHHHVTGSAESSSSLSRSAPATTQKSTQQVFPSSDGQLEEV